MTTTHAPALHRSRSAPAKTSAMRHVGARISPVIGAHCACGGACPRCATAHGAQMSQAPFPPLLSRAPLPTPQSLTTGLRIGRHDDALEREADRVADEALTSAVSPSGRAPPRIQRARGGGDEARADPAAVEPVLTRPGEPLRPALQDEMARRFDHDFSHVRVHRDAAANASAHALRARAYTVGRDIVFAAGQFAPHTHDGRRLLAHELTHVVQQSARGTYERTVQRSCNAAIAPTPATCQLLSLPLGDRRYLFKRECDEFETGEEVRLLGDLALLPAGTTVSIIGAASSDGDAHFNEALSCARAAAAEQVVRGAVGAPTITSVQAVGPQGPLNDPSFRAVSLDFVYPGLTPPAAPSAPLNPDVDLGIYLPVLPSNPVAAYAACWAMPAISGAVCGSAFTGLSCGPRFCAPFPTVSLARECRNKTGLILLAGIAAAVGDTRATPYWTLFLYGGTSSQIDMSATFGMDFGMHSISVSAAHYLSRHLETYLRAAAPTLFVGPGPWTIDFSSMLTTPIGDLERPGHAQEMVFAPAVDIPGLLAGGVGLNQSTCHAGLVPSAFDDHRRATVSATVVRTAGGLMVTPQIDFRVEDTIDFCPGNCGTGAAIAATMLLSRFEASGIAGDVPFLVDYGIAPPPFVI